MKVNLKTILIGLNSIMLCLILILAFTPHSKERVAYVLNEELFNKYGGTKYYEKELRQFQDHHQYILDSMAQSNGEDELKRVFEKQQQFQLEEESLRQQHTARIWAQINQYVGEFGEEKHYDFIYGASGGGNLMYANEAKNITTEVLQYLNDRYEGEL